MIFSESKIPGVWVIEPEYLVDERGFFAHTWNPAEFKKHGLTQHFDQACIAYNEKQHTLRGMHYQSGVHGEDKLVRCTQGSAYDVVIDLRPHSSQFKQWFAIELNALNRKMLYVPPGVAHGYKTLLPKTELFYQITPSFEPEAARGVRWNDPAFKVEWGDTTDIVISVRDAHYADYGLK